MGELLGYAILIFVGMTILGGGGSYTSSPFSGRTHGRRTSHRNSQYRRNIRDKHMSLYNNDLDEY